MDPRQRGCPQNCPDKHGRAVTNRAMEARRRPRGPLPGLLALLLLLRPCGSQTVSSVVCVGDSITYGRTKVAEDGSDGYPHKLEARLGWSHWSVTNLGESGSTAQDVKGDGYVRYSGFYDEALALAADFYVVMLGTNDAKLEHWNATAYEAAIVGLCEAFVAVGGRIVLGVPPPLVKDGHRHWGAAEANAIKRGVVQTRSVPSNLHLSLKWLQTWLSPEDDVGCLPRAHRARRAGVGQWTRTDTPAGLEFVEPIPVQRLRRAHPAPGRRHGVPRPRGPGLPIRRDRRLLASRRPRRVGPARARSDAFPRGHRRAVRVRPLEGPQARHLLRRRHEDLRGLPGELRPLRRRRADVRGLGDRLPEVRHVLADVGRDARPAALLRAIPPRPRRPERRATAPRRRRRT